jgi:fatty-acyl-CoA synthase
MMNLPLTLDVLVRRAASQTGHVEIVSRRADKSLHRTTFGAVVERAQRLARALLGLGVQRGDRVATLMWNHAQHLEAYLGVPLSGGVLHTLNLRLPSEEICWIIRDARDRFLIVDESLLPLFVKSGGPAEFERVYVVRSSNAPVPDGLFDYEDLLAGAPAIALPPLDEDQALGTCYTSGTTGQPKGVVYTHRSTILHSLVSALRDSLDLSRRDTLMPVVPMFHVNAWGLPYTAAMVGCRVVFPGPHLDATSLLDLMEQERVTVAAGVPTIWIGIRDALDAKPRKLQPGVRMIVGGSAAPEQLLRDFDRHGLFILHAWGMTELSPLGLVSRLPPELDALSEADQYRQRAKQGVPPPLVEISVRNEAGEVPHDGKVSGEVLIRAPWVAARYSSQSTPERWAEDGRWFRTGDVAVVDEHGFVQLVDRTADLIKSGGEWLASQSIENRLMNHPSVREAAVIGVPDAKWSERPLAVIAFKEGQSATPETLRAFVSEVFPKFWAPDEFVIVESLPRTSAGKFDKRALRTRYRDSR